MWFVQFLKDNWAVVVEAPWAFASFVVVFGCLGILAGRFLLASHVSSLEHRLRLRNDQIEDYKAKLAGALDESKRIEALEAHLEVLSKPEDIYQNGLKVGTVLVDYFDQSRGVLEFSRIRADVGFDEDADIQFRDAVLHVDEYIMSNETEDGTIRRFYDVLCHVVP